MPYKIYTYEDPYKLDQTDFWEEISALPHFCGARTLVNGLKDVLGDSIKGLICTFDALIEHEDVYKSWTDNIERRVQQYSALTTVFNQLLEKQRIDEKYRLALTQNQNHFLEAIRLFIELGIPHTAIDKAKGNTEQQLFVYILGKAQKSSLFSFPSTPNREKLKEITVSLAGKEIDDCKGPEREIRRCERAKRITEDSPFDAIVVHGLHQFSPAQLRLLMSMDKMGITIIFLFNYQKKYPKIYSSWNEIYSCFDVPIHHDKNIKEYQMPTMQNPSNALASALGELCEERYFAGSPQLKRWHQLYKSIELLEFANITEYAHFVSNHVEVARRKYSESRGVMARGNDVWDNSGVLRFLDEQVYTANRDIHTLLNIYYPEFSQDRHFLSYPIGQFFSAIYRLWDYEKGCISFDSALIKECLSSNVLNAAPGEVLLRTFYNISDIFEQITTYEEFTQEIEIKYLGNYERVISSKSTDISFPLRQLAIYNKYKVTKKDIIALVKAVKEINEIATYLFKIDNSHEDFIDFGKHFQNLEEFLKQRELALASEKERELIYALQLRLDKIKPDKSAFSGTFRDLKEGLHFYLKQKDSGDHDPDWIVKNFEQIDGDILQSKKQFEREEKKTYHFACLSDRDMNLSVNDQLPWPLTDDFLNAAYLPQDLQFQVYCKTLDRRSDFLRYALFYGLCFNRESVRLSFVKQYGDEVTEPYALLSILGFSPKAGLVEEANSTPSFSISIQQEKTKGIKYDRFQMMDMYLCPYRFFLDYVMEDSPVIEGNFLYQKYYENLIIEAVWKRIGGKPRPDAAKYLDRIIDQESQKYEQFFGFWKTTEIYDLKRRARNYLTHEIINKGSGNTVNQYQETHMQMRRQFGAAKFVVDISEIERKNPYSTFESLSIRRYPQKEYSLYRLPQTANQPKADLLRDEAKQYINQVNGKDRAAVPSDWCVYCPKRGTCMESFLSGDMNPAEETNGKFRSRTGTPREKLLPEISAIVSQENNSDVTPGMQLSSGETKQQEYPLIETSEQMPESGESSITSETDSTTCLPDIEATPESPNGKDTSIQSDMSVFEQMLRSIQEMVAGNSLEIQVLKRELSTRRKRQEDTSKLEDLLAQEEKKSKDLLARLEETEGQLASSEARNRSLTTKVNSQSALLEKRQALEFTSEELSELRKYSAIIVFDTCSIMNCSNLLDGVRDGELVVVPKEVNNELENHKVNHYFDDRKIKAQRAITAIYNYKRRYPLIYSDALMDLIPEVYRANEGEKEENDNKILAVAMRYRRYTDIPVVFITDDRSLANKAEGEDIEVWTSVEFLAPPEPSGEGSTNTPELEIEEQAIVDSTETEEQRRKQAQDEFLLQKISTKTLHLEASQISILQNNGIKTIADFLSQTESSFSQMKVKKGIPFTARFLKEQESLKKRIENI